MATIQDIVTGALQKLGVVAGNETPTAADSAYALSELNDMMAEMPGQEIYIGWETVVLTGTFALEDKHIGGTKAMLAVRISPAHGGDGLLSSRLIKQAKDGYARLFGDYHMPDSLSVDDGLTNMPGNWYHGVDNVNV
ncbi:MAG: hypothetical protein GY807_21060 [Gammaproteobacteria bacterium]|nr:hypothetical protein [Gammaproteobacteria bacterium]